MVDDALYLGYSLGARVGWQVCCDLGDRIERAVLGGIPDGRPLGRLDLAQAHAYIERGTPVTDQATQNYVKLAERVPDNSLESLVALAGGMRFGDEETNLENIPSQPVSYTHLAFGPAPAAHFPPPRPRRSGVGWWLAGGGCLMLLVLVLFGWWFAGGALLSAGGDGSASRNGRDSASAPDEQYIDEQMSIAASERQTFHELAAQLEGCLLYTSRCV